MLFKKTHKTIRNYHREKIIFYKRLIIVSIIVFCFSVIILGRLFFLQVINQHQYTVLSKNNILLIKPIAPKRGLILDRNGKILADNKTVYNLTITPDLSSSIKNTINTIGNIIPISIEDKNYFIHSMHRFKKSDSITLKQNISEQQAAELYVNKYRLPSINIEPGIQRIYPYKNATSHIVGYLGRIDTQDYKSLDNANYQATRYIGKTGIEKHFEKELHGKTGVKKSEINASGQIVHDIGIKAPQSGASIKLTIDINLQQAAQNIMGKKVGSIVAIQPSTGDILAMVSTPSFDPNKFINGISASQYSKLLNNKYKPLLNRAIRAESSPGSVIKPFYAFYALHKHLITKNDYIVDRGWFEIANTTHIFHNWAPGFHGKINLEKAIIVSNDTYFYNLANDMGIHNLDNALHMFQFGQVTGIALPNESSGLIPSPHWKLTHLGHPWYTGDTINAGIGQGYLLTTPLQLASATSVIANRGIYISPHIVQMPKSHNKPSFKLSANTNDKSNWNEVIKDMGEVITNPNGTGGVHFGRHPGYTVAAKTGTVQLHGHCKDEYESANDNKLPESQRCNEMFIAFAPIIKPKIAIAVFIEHNGSASKMARKVIDRYFAILKKREKNA